METTSELRDEAHTAAKHLIRAEVALLREEFQGELRKVKVSALAFGVAGVAGLLGVSALVETLVVSGAVRPGRGLAAGFGLLGLAAWRAWSGIARSRDARRATHRAACRCTGSVQTTKRSQRP